MTEKIELKAGTPQKSEVENVPIWATPENLPFFKDEIYQLFSYSCGSNIPKWMFADILQCKKYKILIKTPQNTYFTTPLTESKEKKTPCSYFSML